MKALRRAAALLALWLMMANPASAAAQPRASRSTNDSAATAPVHRGMPRVEYEKVPTLQMEDLPQTTEGVPLVARVNGTPITEPEFQKELRRMAPQSKTSPAQFEAMKTALAGRVVDKLVRDELAQQFAANAGLTVSDEEIDRQIRVENLALPPGNKLQDYMLRMGEPMEDLRATVREILLREKVENYISSFVEPPNPEQLEQFRKQNPRLIRATTATGASHIVIRALPNQSDEEIEQARQRAQQILDEIRGGMDFETAARQYSQDRTTVHKSGDLGYFSPGTMYPEFDAAVARLQPGEVSDLVRTPVGFHIIKVHEQNPDNAREAYMKEERRKAVEKWWQEALDRAEVERYLK